MAGQTSIVLELQRLAADSGTSVTDLLRKALLVAAKLRLADFREWIDLELNGYKGALNKVPPYRWVMAELKLFNPYNGWIPVHFKTTAMKEAYSKVPAMNTIAEIEEISSKSDGYASLSLSPEAHAELMEEMDWAFKMMMPKNHIAISKLTGILAHVRNTVLEWSLKLEEEGILGDGMSFSESEKKKAAEASGVHIENFHGVMGHGIYGAVTATNVSIGDFGQINTKLKEMGISRDVRNQLEDLIDELRAAKPEDKPGIMKRGMAWVTENGASLGAMATVIAGWFGGSHSGS